jgi:A/G-specific adenine glycosylase
MPWRDEKEPYKIWLSEVILQQTRVEQGLPYYERFVARFPNVIALAHAQEEEVLKLWEGLGYYSRARNLHAAAKYVAQELNGKFPDTYDSILKMKGVGPYTAAALASFAYGLPHAVLDGNVYRVLSRIFGIETPIDLPQAKKQFTALAQQLLDPARPGEFNQAMMDFGATCCTPQPQCMNCPFKGFCKAEQKGQARNFPVKSKQNAKKSRFFLYLVLIQGNEIFIKKRTNNDIWQGLYEFPMLEVAAEEQLTENSLENCIVDYDILQKLVFGKKSELFLHVLTHRHIHARFIEVHLLPECEMNDSHCVLLKEAIKVPITDLKKKFAFHRLILRFLEKNL